MQIGGHAFYAACKADFGINRTRCYLGARGRLHGRLFLYRSRRRVCKCADRQHSFGRNPSFARRVFPSAAILASRCLVCLGHHAFRSDSRAFLEPVSLAPGDGISRGRHPFLRELSLWRPQPACELPHFICVRHAGGVVSQDPWQGYRDHHVHWQSTLRAAKRGRLHHHAQSGLSRKRRALFWRHFVLCAGCRAG